MKNAEAPAGGARRLSPAAILTVAALSAPLLLSAAACAPPPPRPCVQVLRYNDCYIPIRVLREEAGELREKIAQGASQTTLEAFGEFGAAPGASVAAIADRELQSRSQAERFAAYAQYIDEDYSALRSAFISARAAAGCYQKAYDKLSRDYKLGRMDEAGYLESLAEIRDGSADAQKILRDFRDAAAANMATFDKILEAEAARTDDKAPASRARALTQALQKNQKAASEAQDVDKTLGALAAASAGGLPAVQGRPEGRRQGRQGGCGG
jgi:hypothetical protein